MPVVKTKGAASSQGFGEFAKASTVANYIEDVFSTYLYTGTGTTPQTITNGIDLSTKGGLVWSKSRSATGQNILIDTVRGAANQILSNSTAANFNCSFPAITSFGTTGYTVTGDTDGYNPNSTGGTFASWTFRKQPKFFDIVTYTGTGSAQSINHNLGAVPGCVIVKCTSTGGAGYGWPVWHRSLTSGTGYAILESTAAANTGTAKWNSTDPTATQFTVGTSSDTNSSGQTYVAYLFAHNAGGFGLTGTDNVISCGSFTTDIDAYVSVDLGYEPQWILYKPTSTVGDWRITDNMRGWTQTGYSRLFPNLSNAESSGNGFYITSTGFKTDTSNFALLDSQTYIYIAIRRGPMKVPTDATKVFIPVAQDPSVNSVVTTNFPVSLVIDASRANPSSRNRAVWDRLRGGALLTANTTDAEASSTNFSFASNTSVTDTYGSLVGYGSTVYWNFQRAPGFFDEVCYTGTGSATTVTHNLGVAPELMIVKSRSTAGTDWPVYQSNLGGTGYLYLNTSDLASTGNTSIWNGTSPSSSAFSVGTNVRTNGSGATYVAYLFATCPGVSKVGSYTGTGALQTINCGFTGGARFVLIKRTDSTGDWYVYDSARGISSSTDPYLFLNSTAAEVTGTNYVDTDTTGFKVTAAAPAGLNASGGTYIFLAIA